LTIFDLSAEYKKKRSSNVEDRREKEHVHIYL
jgi:hypothetical protein